MDPLGGGAGDSGAPTINARKHRQRPPWEAVSKIREHPPSTRKMSTVGPLGGGVGDPGSPTISVKKRQRWAFWEVVLENPRAPPINA
jgi:hypothetical protein